MTAIPWIVLAMLGQPDPATVQTQVQAANNIICWTTPTQAVCFAYRDEGTHLAVTIN